MTDILAVLALWIAASAVDGIPLDRQDDVC